MALQDTIAHLQSIFLSIPPNYALPLLLAVLLLATRLFRTKSPPPSPPSSHPRDRKSQAQRTPGHWPPSSYRLPLPPPYANWSLTDTKPLPYRPFRYGPKYHVTMGLRTVSSDDWIELDNQFPKYHADKARRIAERGEKCCITAPEAYDAATELLEELARYLSARYPTLYTLSKSQNGGDQILHNLYSGEIFNISERPLKEDPMTMCGRLVQDDLAIMIERPDGQYYLLAGSILLPGFWRLTDKFGMSLSEIHTSGEVPQFREKLEKGMTNFFKRVKPEEMVARNNYFMQVDDELAWSWSIGSEDAEEIEGWKKAEKDRAVECHWFRSERQTLRRLPRSGGVVFTIRTYFERVVDLAVEEGVPGRLASAVRSWGEDVARYKGRERYGEILLEWLDRKHEEQVARGVKEEEGGYPF